MYTFFWHHLHKHLCILSWQALTIKGENKPIALILFSATRWHSILFEFSQVLSSATSINTSSTWTCICKIGLFIFLGEPLWETLSDYFWSHRTQIILGHLFQRFTFSMQSGGWEVTVSPEGEGRVQFPRSKLLSKHLVLIYFRLYWRECWENSSKALSHIKISNIFLIFILRLLLSFTFYLWWYVLSTSQKRLL